MTMNASRLLEGSRVLVTGAARGLGLALTREIVAAGGIVAMADIRAALLEESAAVLRAEGYTVHAIPLDLGDPVSIEKCASCAAELMGGMDGLVNNAAVTDSGGCNLEQLEIDMWDKVMQVNVRGTWLMTRACVPYLRVAQGGTIVNLASDTPLWGAPNLLAYVASKGAIIAMTRSMARELGSDQITVNTVCPGLTLVEATEYVPEARHRLYEDQRAIHRAQMPDDVSGTVVYALSGLARFVTGQMLVVNGGFVMN